MRARIIAAVAGIAAAVALCGPVQAKDQAIGSNPLVGKAVVSINTMTDNKSVVGKGAYADYYGYYGNYYSQAATSMGAAGYQFKNPSYYSAASNYAYNAYYYFYYASYYEAQGR